MVERKTTESSWQSMGFISGKGNSTEINNYSYIDREVTPGKYTYRLKQIDYDGSFKFSNEISIEVLQVNTFSLLQNYPNPFNPSTSIKYRIPTDEFVTLKVYDVLGREVATLMNDKQGRGEYNVNFNASKLSSGIYYYTITAGNYTETKKMMLLK
jgi:hypothetical protein